MTRARRFLIGVFFWSFVLSSVGWPASHYISPSGTDAGDCTNSGSPCKTFAYALAAARMPAGDELVLSDGTYSAAAATGVLSINCSTNQNNGTVSAPITVRAANSRAALIQDTGASAAMNISNCQYWTFTGLRAQGADLNSGTNGTVINVSSSHYLEFKYMLVAYNNRYKNSHLLAFTNSCNNNKVIDSEFYYFHRHGILNFGGSSNNTYRRNYFNSRGYSDISGGQSSGITTRGDAAIAIYPGSNCILENNISEGNMCLMNIEATWLANNNKSYGDISLNDVWGALLKARDGTTVNQMPQNTVLTNYVSITSSNNGFYFRGNKNTQCINCTAYDPVSASGAGVQGDFETTRYGDGAATFSAVNTLVVGSALYGFRAVASGGYTQTGTVDYPNAATSVTNKFVGLSATHENTDAHGLGACRVWIPDASDLKGAGLSGADIGATVLYRYVNGVLTGTPLWDQSTGAFPCGAQVAGFNDTAGNSCINVFQRLNVNYGGCDFPAGYTTGGGGGGDASIQLTSFNSAVTYRIGSIQTISWAAANFGGAGVRIELSRDGGTNYSDIVASTTDDGAYEWTLTAPRSETCKIRVSKVAEAGINAVSAANFKIGGKYLGLQ